MALQERFLFCFVLFITIFATILSNNEESTEKITNPKNSEQGTPIPYVGDQEPACRIVQTQGWTRHHMTAAMIENITNIIKNMNEEQGVLNDEDRCTFTSMSEDECRTYREGRIFISPAQCLNCVGSNSTINLDVVNRIVYEHMILTNGDSYTCIHMQSDKYLKCICVLTIKHRKVPVFVKDVLFNLVLVSCYDVCSFAGKSLHNKSDVNVTCNMLRDKLDTFTEFSDDIPVCEIHPPPADAQEIFYKLLAYLFINVVCLLMLLVINKIFNYLLGLLSDYFGLPHVSTLDSLILLGMIISITLYLM